MTITTAMAHLARLVAVKSIAIGIYIFADEDICLAIAELTTVKYADFDHSYHLLS
jgi:hypothetical protein